MSKNILYLYPKRPFPELCPNKSDVCPPPCGLVKGLLAFNNDFCSLLLGWLEVNKNWSFIVLDTELCWLNIPPSSFFIAKIPLSILLLSFLILIGLLKKNIDLSSFFALAVKIFVSLLLFPKLNLKVLVVLNRESLSFCCCCGSLFFSSVLISFSSFLFSVKFILGKKGEGDGFMVEVFPRLKGLPEGKTLNNDGSFFVVSFSWVFCLISIAFSWSLFFLL